MLLFPSSTLRCPALLGPAQRQCMRPIVLGLLFVIVIVSQIRCQNPIAERLLGPLHPGRQQFPVIGLHAEGMFHADAYYCLLLITVLFLLIMCSSLLRMMLEFLHPPVSKIMGNGREDSKFLSFKWLLGNLRLYLRCAS